MSLAYSPFLGYLLWMGSLVLRGKNGSCMILVSNVDWLVTTPDGKVWTQHRKQGIVSSNGQKWKVEFNIDNSPLGNSTTNTPLVTSTGKILLGTDLGLFQYDSDLLFQKSYFWRSKSNVRQKSLVSLGCSLVLPTSWGDSKMHYWSGT